MELQVGDIVYLEPGFGFLGHIECKFGVVLRITETGNVYHTVLDEDENPIPTLSGYTDWITTNGIGLTLIHRPSSLMSKKKMKKHKFVV
jgi:hypothetical protein